MWIESKSKKEFYKQLQDIANGAGCETTYNDVDMVVGKDKDKFLTDNRGLYETVLFTENYALIRLPDPLPDNFKTNYNVQINHVASFSK